MQVTARLRSWILLGMAASACAETKSVDACGGGCSGSSGEVVTLWRTSGGPGLTGVPLVTDELVVTGGLDGVVRAFERESGKLTWEVTVGGQMSSSGPPVITGNRILVPHGFLVALNKQSGKVLWRFGGHDGEAGVLSPAVSGDTVFSATINGWVYAIDGTSGQPLWTVQLEGLAAFDPVLSDNLVIVGTRGRTDAGLGAGFAIALRKDDGSEEWRVALPDSSGFPASGGAVHGGFVHAQHVYVGTTTARLLAIRLAGGTVDWEAAVTGVPNFASADYRIPGRLLGTTLVLPRSDAITEGRRIDDGTLQWTVNASSYGAAPAVHDAVAYLFNNVITAIDESGRVVWSVGGFEQGGERNYLFGTVAEDGTLFTIAVENPATASTSLSALRIRDAP